MRAVCDGLIVKAGPDDPIDEKQGKRVVQIVSLIGYDFWWLRYRHLRQPIPHPGYRVKQGDPIGYSGKNGESYLCVELLDPKGQYHPIPFHES